MPSLLLRGSFVSKKSFKNKTLQDAVAIIGMGCCFPGIEHDLDEPEALFDFLLQKQSAIRAVPENRWPNAEYFDSDRSKPDKMISQKGGFIQHPEYFDAAFFKISAAEARQMDPQQRLFLETAIHALNDANIKPSSLDNTNTGVFCGASTQDYSQLNIKDQIEFNGYTLTGVAQGGIAGRLSYVLNLKGPSMAIDTACSSSLAALSVAVTALQQGQCDLAIVGGVHLSLLPENYIGFTKANMLSEKNQCRSFDAEGDGFIHSEGCGVVILKRLYDAQSAGNKIHALIKSVFMNQDGHTPRGIAAPNLQAQIAMHEGALEQAGLKPEDISYIEAHGAGTALGDAVEFNALAHIHQGRHSFENPLIIGAVKSNLGHTLAASGMTSLIKALKVFKRELIPPNLHFTEPNKRINPKQIPAVFPDSAQDFCYQPHRKRFIQINNFGFTGTNATVILEEPPRETSREPAAESLCCFILSAKSETSLRLLVQQYVQYLSQTSASLSDICFNLINGRDHYAYRLGLLVHTREDLITQLEHHPWVIHHIVPETTSSIVGDHAEIILQEFLAGKNITIKTEYLPLSLPGYTFAHQSYWHEVRKLPSSRHWLDNLPTQDRGTQLSLLKDKIRQILHAYIPTMSQHSDHEDLLELQMTEEQIAAFGQQLYEELGRRFYPQIKSYMTIEKIASYLQSVLLPLPVAQQPVVNILHEEPIAIIGMSCRFPQAENTDAFYSLLLEGRSGMQDIPKDRWDNAQYYDPDIHAAGRLYIKQLGLIQNVSSFDADFFNVSPREAKFMAPQLRVFLETSYHALEDANIPLPKIKGSSTGVFVGCGTNEYPDWLTSQGITLDDFNIYFATGNVLNAVPGRVAYVFDLQGPTQAIDTACSSSMTALHNACISLQAGDCDMALAGGINILMMPDSNITLSKARMLSPESLCKTFSIDADGYARSEGCGVLVLKRLSSAMNDGDTILAVVRGSAINSDGKSGGFTVPNAVAQEEVIRRALAKAKLSPAEVDLIEAHGTGTPLADPIEANTLMAIFAEDHSEEHPLYLGSVKTNIGHAESASGIAGVIKTILSLQHHILFKHLNFKSLNPEIKLKNTQISLETMQWPKPQGLRIAGVSSFGFSGANAHVILEESPPIQMQPPAAVPESLLLISAKNRQALDLLLAQYATFLTHTQAQFADICFTSAVGRTHFLYRVAIRAQSKEEAVRRITQNQYEIYCIKKEHKPQHHWHTLPQMEAAYQLGFILDWEQFYKEYAPQVQKVKLPLYEFIREDFSFKENQRIKETLLPRDWSYQVQWEERPLPKSNNTKVPGTWLLLGNSSCQPLLEQQGFAITTTTSALPSSLQGILFVAPYGTIADGENFLEQQKNLMKEFLACIKTYSDAKLRLIVVTTNALPELVTKEINLSASALVGFCKTLALEVPQLQSVLIDFPETLTPALVQQLHNELVHNVRDSWEHIVAYRQHKRWVPRLETRPLLDTKPNLYGRGRFLITGGSGGLGLVSAQALFAAGAQEVILCARTIHQPQVQQDIERIRALYPGRTLLGKSADLTDKEQVRSLLLELNGDGQLRGIIHAAALGVKKPLLEHTDEDIDTVFTAKVRGAWYLHELTQEMKLEFFIIYSSISSVFGSNRESIYSGANSFCDALIAQRHQQQLTGLAIQWGPWGETGMAKARAQVTSLQGTLITNAQGLSFLKALLRSSAREQAIISPDYLRFMLDFVPQPAPNFYRELRDKLNNKPTNSASSLSDKPALWGDHYRTMDAEQRLRACQELVNELCCEILERPDLDHRAGFFELGFDSLMMTELASKLKKNLQPVLSLPVSVVFDYPSITKLTEFIHQQLEQKLSAGILNTSPVVDEKDIAIIGMSCNFPKAADIDAYRELLNVGRDGMQTIPPERWDNNLYYDPNPDAVGKSYVNKMGLIRSIKEFDAAFFGVSPREARLLEPQQRLFLECAYQAIEYANYPPSSLSGSRTGVFTGVGPNEFYGHLEQAGFNDDELNLYSITGNVLNLIPGRVAYFFDFKGPALSIDTACSSSLVAIHYACQSLKNGEVDYALAGGVNVLLRPESNITLSKAKALSPDGACKTFDADANGYARGEGCGVIFLKRLKDAVRDKDHVLAVIKASAVNHDGKAAGLTVPRGTSQEAVMTAALAQTSIKPQEITYLETHGTGTPLGDPIEVHAINKVYGQGTDRTPLYLGAVKTNIGHLESASGIASVIKVILSIQEQTIYKNLHFQRLNPHIQLNHALIPTETQPWIVQGARYAAVNAFGFSGTNAHILIGEYIQDKSPPEPLVTPSTLVLSAKSKPALQALISKYIKYLHNTAARFADICFTAATGRDHFTYRIAVTATTAPEAAELLEQQNFAASWDAESKLFKVPSAIKLNLGLYLQGHDVDWQKFYEQIGYYGQKVVLPYYCFDRQLYWPQPRNNINQSHDNRIIVQEPEANTQGSPPHLIAGQAELSHQQRLETLRDLVCALAGSILQSDDYAAIKNQGLISLGLDSLMALELRNKIHDQIQCPGLNLPIEYFINNPSVETIAQKIMQELSSLPSTAPVQLPVSSPPVNQTQTICDFQYIFWVLNQYHFSFNVGMQIQLRGAMNVSWVNDAFKLVAANQGALWLAFTQDNVQQTLRKEGIFQIQVQDWSFKQPNQELLNSEFRYNILKLIPLEQPPLLRVYLYKINEETHEMHLVIPHIIADDTTCEILFAEFKHFYELLHQGKKLPAPQMNHEFIQYVQMNNQSFNHQLHEKLNFWRRYNRGFCLPKFTKRYHLPDAIGQMQNLYHFTLPKNTVHAFITWHQQRNINVSTGLISLVHLAFYRMNTNSSLPITLIHGGREGSRYRDVAGLFAHYKRLNLSLKSTLYKEQLKIIEEQLDKAASYQNCSHFIKNQGLANEQLTWFQYGHYLYYHWKFRDRFKKAGMRPLTSRVYLEYLSKFAANRHGLAWKNKINSWLHLNLPLLKPAHLRIILSITPSFFAKEPPSREFANLSYFYPGHYACMDRPVGNQTLWIYFSQNQEGEYQLSLNGPITPAAKKLIAMDIERMMNLVINDENILLKKLMENDDKA